MAKTDPRILERNKLWAKNNPEKRREIARRSYHKRKHLPLYRVRKYDLTVEQYEVMLDKQKGRCKICERKKPLDIDHCHKTGKVRGLLCRACNTLVGYIEKHANLLDKVSSYTQGEAM